MRSNDMIMNHKDFLEYREKEEEKFNVTFFLLSNTPPYFFDFRKMYKFLLAFFILLVVAFEATKSDDVVGDQQQNVYKVIFYGMTDATCSDTPLGSVSVLQGNCTHIGNDLY